MNIRELQQSYEDRLKGMRGFIYKQVKTDEDLRQEACMAMWRGLLKDNNAIDGFLMNRMRCLEERFIGG
jgi:DNA-directed RNA polymerase specialized sigma24 family protein